MLRAALPALDDALVTALIATAFQQDGWADKAAALLRDRAHAPPALAEVARQVLDRRGAVEPLDAVVALTRAALDCDCGGTPSAGAEAATELVEAMCAFVTGDVERMERLARPFAAALQLPEALVHVLAAASGGGGSRSVAALKALLDSFFPLPVVSSDPASLPAYWQAERARDLVLSLAHYTCRPSGGSWIAAVAREAGADAAAAEALAGSFASGGDRGQLRAFLERLLPNEPRRVGRLVETYRLVREGERAWWLFDPQRAKRYNGHGARAPPRAPLLAAAAGLDAAPGALEAAVMLLTLVSRPPNEVERGSLQRSGKAFSPAWLHARWPAIKACLRRLSVDHEKALEGAEPDEADASPTEGAYDIVEPRELPKHPAQPAAAATLRRHARAL